MDKTLTRDWTAQMEEIFPVVQASKLSTKDSYLQHIPETEAQNETKKMIMCAINVGGLQDFRKPIMDPSVDENGEIIFCKGNQPAIGFSAEWWDNAVKNMMPAKNSRIGTKKEYAAFLGILIKTLVEEEKFSVASAWRAVCDNSCHLGHYTDSLFGIMRPEPTGSRPVGKWCDLANTRKFVKTGAFFYAKVSGCYEVEGTAEPVAHFKDVEMAKKSDDDVVGWIVMDV